MFAALLARSAKNPSDLAIRFVEVLSNLRLDYVLDVDLKRAFFDGGSITVSKPVGDGKFRVPQLSPNLKSGTDARLAFEQWLDNKPPYERPVIDPAFEVIGFVPDFTVLQGPALPKENETAEADPKEADDRAKDHDDPYGSFGDPNDFLNLTWQGIGDARGMTAVILPQSRAPIHDSLAGLAAGGELGGGRWWLRADISLCTPENKDGGGSLLILRSLRNGKR